MMKINTICYNRLRNDEFLGLHQNIVELTASITGEEIRPSIEAYRKAVTEYANLIEVSVDESAASIVSRLDKERNAAYAASRNFAKSLKSLADKDVVATGERLRKIFIENADPFYLNQDQSTGVITNIVNSLKAIGDAKLEACGFKPWLENLEKKNNDYLAAVQTRNKELAAKENGLTKVYRERCLDAFGIVATLAIGKATLESDEGCTQFIKAVNSHIELKKAHLKLRKGKGKITVTPETPETAVIEIPTETKDEENAA